MEIQVFAYFKDGGVIDPTQLRITPANSNELIAALLKNGEVVYHIEVIVCDGKLAYVSDFQQDESLRKAHPLTHPFGWYRDMRVMSTSKLIERYIQ